MYEGKGGGRMCVRMIEGRGTGGEQGMGKER